MAFTNLCWCLDDEATTKFLKNLHWAQNFGFCIFSRQQITNFEFLAPRSEIPESQKKCVTVQPPTIPPTLDVTMWYFFWAKNTFRKVCAVSRSNKVVATIKVVGIKAEGCFTAGTEKAASEHCL